MIYVTYNASGDLTGAYEQNLHPSHAGNHIQVTAQQKENWVLYRANAARNGLEVAPPVVPDTVVPQEITRRQALQQLRAEGFKAEDIRTMIRALPITEIERDLALIEFDESQTFQRNRPLVTTMAAMLGKDAAATDLMFINAAKR